MQVRRCRAASRKNEIRQRRQLAIHLVDRPFQVVDAPRIDAGEPVVSGSRKLRADLEQIVLDALELRVEG